MPYGRAVVSTVEGVPTGIVLLLHEKSTSTIFLYVFFGYRLRYEMYTKYTLL